MTIDRRSVETLAETFADSWTAGMVGGRMTCAEADALADVIRQVDPEAADTFLRGHANGWDNEGGDTDPGDLHYSLREDPAASRSGKTYDHDPVPDDLPQPGDRCKTCGEPITWLGPSTVTDWMHVDDQRNV